MRFGGHETFAIREGWLHKGLKLLIEQPERLVDEYSADWLGVGRNMAKSIRHWLLATGLAEKSTGQGSKKNARLQPTDLGQMIYDRDLYFSEIGTWWALHVNLVNAPDHAASWVWFFNHFNLNRFERSVCVESLRRHMQMTYKRKPNPKTLQRDMNCLLNTYAKRIPEENIDPEEALDCPFVELGLMTYFRTSGYFQTHQGPKDISPQLLGYALSKSIDEASDGKGTVDISIRQAAQTPGGPGRAFVLTGESLFELTLSAESKAKSDEIQIAGLAGERVIRISRKSPLNWMKEYYSVIGLKERHAA